MPDDPQPVELVYHHGTEGLILVILLVAVLVLLLVALWSSLED
jgi:hypothetical protein